MDDIRRPQSVTRRSEEGSVTHLLRSVQPVLQTHSEQPKKVIKINVHLSPRLIRLARHYLRLKRWQRYTINTSCLAVVLVLVLEIFTPFLSNLWQENVYALSTTDRAVISKTDDGMAKNLSHDTASHTYNFSANQPTQLDGGNAVTQGGSLITATLHDDLSKGITITDTQSRADFTITPQFGAMGGHQDKNQIDYPVSNGNMLIYTAQAGGIKEDILVKHESGDTLRFRYTLGLDGKYAAKLLSDGSLGIYGSSLPLNSVTTSDAKDAALVQKARQKAAKDTLLFVLPAPTIRQAAGQLSKGIKASYSLKGNELTVTATNLKQAHYPISIDPTVQISTTSEFYRNTSVESNADFNVAGNKITRGALTGGTTTSWTGTATMNQSRFLAGATAFNGYMYVIGGVSGTTTTNLAGNNANMVEVSQISATDPSIAAGTYSTPNGAVTNPSTLGTWTAGNKSGLPAGGLSRFQLIGYKGFLYMIGGSTTDNTCAGLSSTVYYAAVQVNGVLSNWQTTNAPSVARCDFGATAYNGKIYIAGGKTATTSTGTTDVSYATVNPDGTLTWTNGGAGGGQNPVVLPAARYGADMQAYNGYLYLVGGNLSGTVTNTVLYAALNTNGSLYGTGSSSWLSTNVFTNARENLGGLFTVIKNGYFYLSGGCKSVNASQTCNTAGDVMSDNQLAQINADGSLGQWATTTTLTAARVGATAVVWRGTIYNLDGCATTSAAALTCATTLASTQYATITTPGQASVLKTNSNTLTTATFGASAAVLNGYLYVVGGCIVNDCTSGSPSVTNQTYYAQINTDGTLGSWQNNAANTINGTGTISGVAETALVAANGSLYAFGGYNDQGDINNAWSVTPSASTGALPGVWTQLTGGLGGVGATHAMSVLYYNGYFITFGGCTAAGAFGCSTQVQDVTRYTITGTTLNTGVALTSLPTTSGYPNAAMGMAFYNNRVYLCGGVGTASQTQNCIYNNFTSASPPTLSGTWSLMTALLNYDPIAGNNHPIRRTAAYAANGYLYVYSGHDGQNNVSVGSINIGKIGASGDIAQTDMSISTTAFTPKWDTASAFADGNIYTVGGCIAGAPPGSCTSRDNHTEYFQIYNATNSGTRAISTSSNSLSTSVTGASATASNGYLYVAGGCVLYNLGPTSCSGGTGASSFAPINPDGSLGAFSAGPNFPSVAQSSFGCFVTLNGTLYYAGGFNGSTPQTNVYYSTATGASWGSGSWVTATNGLLAAKGGLSCATYNNRIYVTGGSTSATVYYSPSLSNGGDIASSWTSSTAFTTGRSYHTTVAAGGYLYVIGGFDGTNYLSDVQFAQIASNGSVGNWSFANDIPLKERQMGAYAANGYIYVMGGATGTVSTSCQSATYVASINSDGTLGAWNQGVATSFTALLGPAVAFYNGFYYVAGGNNCGGSNVLSVYYGGEQSQAIRSIFTRYIDLVGDATPQKFVINGTNAAVNSVNIEKWRMRYQSCRIGNVASGFGQTTTLASLNFGPNPFAISALNTSGGNEGVARYWSITFDIDQSQSFSFIDANQPAIISYSFYYSPSGNTRLRNGRIFQDQAKQSLDAHP